MICSGRSGVADGVRPGASDVVGFGGGVGVFVSPVGDGNVTAIVRSGSGESGEHEANKIRRVESAIKYRKSFSSSTQCYDLSGGRKANRSLNLSAIRRISL